MTERLDDFFGPRPGEDAAPPPAPPPEPKAQQQAEAHAPAAPHAPQPEATPIPEPKPGDRTVPLSALMDERNKRQDYKTQAAALEAELRVIKEQQGAEKAERERLQQQLEEARKAPPAPPPQPSPMPNPTEDPAGYATFLREQTWNDLCNRSEAAFKQANPGVDTTAMVARLAQEIRANPALGQELRNQFHPFEWLNGKLKKLDGLKQIGDDPDAYAAKLREQIRAELAAEMQQPAPAVPAPKQAPRLPASLASVPNAGDREPNPYLGPTPLEDVLGR